MLDVKMTLLNTYLLCVAGIIVSILLPILKALLPKPLGVDANSGKAFWDFAKPYLIVGLFSLITGLLIVAFTWGTITDPRAAILAGYAWDSTLQKISKP